MKNFNSSCPIMRNEEMTGQLGFFYVPHFCRKIEIAPTVLERPMKEGAHSNCRNTEIVFLYSKGVLCFWAFSLFLSLLFMVSFRNVFFLDINDYNTFFFFKKMSFSSKYSYTVIGDIDCVWLEPKKGGSYKLLCKPERETEHTRSTIFWGPQNTK